jgi:hypothetical protein
MAQRCQAGSGLATAQALPVAFAGANIHPEVRPSTPTSSGSVVVEGAPEDGPAAVLFNAHGLTQYFLGFVQNVVQIAPPFFALAA